MTILRHPLVVLPAKIASATSARKFVAGGLLALFAAASPAGAVSEFGTRDEAVAMVHRVQEMFKKLGAEGTFAAIKRKAPGTIDRDLYAYVIDTKDFTNWVVMANGAIPTMTTGTSLWDFRDQNGKYLGREQAEVCKSGRGWVDFRFLSPLTQQIDDKSAYIERIGDTSYCIGVGIYRNEQINENTVAIVSGSPSADDTYLQIANDMASVLNDADKLRILPIVGVGGPQNIRDVRYLKGVDIGLTQLSVLNSFRSSNATLGKYDDKIVYIAKLFNEEVHLIAGRDITSIEQLNGRKVNIDEVRSGTSQTMRDVFKRLGIKIQEVNVIQGQAFEMLKAGEIAATAYVSGKSAKLISNMKFERGMHFIQVPFSKEISDAEYLPTDLTHDDYPDLIPAGQTIQTIADEVVLIGYNWPKNTDRYRRVQRFVDAFFPKIEEFRKPPNHPKWREVNLAVTVKGWKRFDPAEEWLASARNPDVASLQSDFRQFTSSQGGAQRGVVSPANSDELFQEFLKWKQSRPGR